jgi:putative transport protein
MIKLLVDNPLLTLFGIIAIGHVIGRIRIGSFSLGVAAVLFTGLGVSAAWPELQLPDIVYMTGLVLFVYTIGLSAGPGFLASLRGRGVALNALVFAVLASAVAVTLVLANVLDLHPVTAAGMYTGALTNTPALAGILDALPQMVDGPRATALAGEAVVGYSLAYPIGVLGTIAAMSVLQRLWRIDHAAEAEAAGLAPVPLEHWTVRVRRTDRPAIDTIAEDCEANVTVSRVQLGTGVHVPARAEHLERGELVTLVGTAPELRKATRWLGDLAEEDLVEEPGMSFRRVFVSNPAIVGRSLRDLRLPDQHGITITRIRRGDRDMVATSSTILELGDRVRIVAPTAQMREASLLIGDSYRGMSELDVFTFALGICLGLLVGLIPIPIPGGGTVHLGIAGGPLLVALVLGARGNTGRLFWQVPFGANLTVRQLGTVLFLAGIGTRAGQAFGSAISDPSSLLIIGAGAVLTFGASIATLVIAHKFMNVPFGQAMGVLAGLQTQPAVLVYADEQTGNELSGRGYTTVYPMAMIAKIVAAQLLLVALL